MPRWSSRRRPARRACRALATARNGSTREGALHVAQPLGLRSSAAWAPVCAHAQQQARHRSWPAPARRASSSAWLKPRSASRWRATAASAAPHRAASSAGSTHGALRISVAKRRGPAGLAVELVAARSGRTRDRRRRPRHGRRPAAAGARRQRPHCGNARRQPAMAQRRQRGWGWAKRADAGFAQRLRGPGAANRALAGQGGRKPFDQAAQHRLNILVRILHGRPTPAHHRPRCRARAGSSVAPARSPWLHEEVARRMEDRLQWIRLEPQGLGPLGAGARRPAGPGAARAPLPAGAECFVVEARPARAERGARGSWPGPGGGAGAAAHGIMAPLPDGAASRCCGPTWRCTWRPTRRR